MHHQSITSLPRVSGDVDRPDGPDRRLSRSLSLQVDSTVYRLAEGLLSWHLRHQLGAGHGPHWSLSSM